jgi:hypothetical protein
LSEKKKKKILKWVYEGYRKMKFFPYVEIVFSSSFPFKRSSFRFPPFPPPSALPGGDNGSTPPLPGRPCGPGRGPFFCLPTPFVPPAAPLLPRHVCASELHAAPSGLLTGPKWGGKNKEGARNKNGGTGSDLSIVEKRPLGKGRHGPKNHRKIIKKKVTHPHTSPVDP